MSSEQAQCSKRKLKYFPQKVNSKCQECEAISKKFDAYKDAAEKRYSTIIDILAEHKIRQMKILLGGNVERNFHQVFGHEIIMNSNVDGSFGKKRLKDYANVYTSIMDVISTFNDSPDKTLRAAFQRQKTNFKQASRKRAKKDDDSSENE